MSTDHLPHGDMAPGTRAHPPAAASHGQTITVQIRRSRNARDDEPMGGTLSLAAADAVPGTLHAAVVAADALSLTITL